MQDQLPAQAESASTAPVVSRLNAARGRDVFTGVPSGVD
jgi:hypothetical protein